MSSYLPVPRPRPTASSRSAGTIRRQGSRRPSRRGRRPRRPVPTGARARQRSPRRARWDGPPRRRRPLAVRDDRHRPRRRTAPSGRPDDHRHWLAAGAAHRRAVPPAGRPHVAPRCVAANPPNRTDLGTPLTAESLTLGYRIDVQIDSSDMWLSLCRRVGTYKVNDTEFFTDHRDEGHLKVNSAVDHGDNVCAATRSSPAGTAGAWRRPARHWTVACPRRRRSHPRCLST